MWKKIGILMLALALTLTLAACGDGGTTDSDTASKGGKDNTASANAGDQAAADDKALLEAKGYEVTVITNKTSMIGAEGSILAESGDLVAVLNAYLNKEGESNKYVFVYYFKDAAQAQKCYEKSWTDSSSYRCSGAKLITSNTEDSSVIK